MSMVARLVAQGGDAEDIPLDRVTIIVGRHPTCDARLDSPRISRRHCCVTQEQGETVVRDLGSTNGIRINGQRVEFGKLRPGDELSIAHVRYRFEVEDEAHAGVGGGPRIGYIASGAGPVPIGGGSVSVSGSVSQGGAWGGGSATAGREDSTPEPPVSPGAGASFKSTEPIPPGVASGCPTPIASSALREVVEEAIRRGLPADLLDKFELRLDVRVELAPKGFGVGGGGGGGGAFENGSHGHGSGPGPGRGSEAGSAWGGVNANGAEGDGGSSAEAGDRDRNRSRVSPFPGV